MEELYLLAALWVGLAVVSASSDVERRNGWHFGWHSNSSQEVFLNLPELLRAITFYRQTLLS